jgi:hypothetical protein
VYFYYSILDAVLLETALIFPITVIYTDTTGFSEILGSRNGLPRADTGQARFRTRGASRIPGHILKAVLWRATVAHVLKGGKAARL